MKATAYLELMKKHQEELEAFPMAYAFNESQLNNALIKLETTKDQLVDVGMGGLMRRSDIPAFNAMMKRQREELDKFLEDEEQAEAAFLYEMDNHEYAINWDGDTDVLSCFELTYEELKRRNLVNAYSRARKAHMKHAMEWNMV